MAILYFFFSKLTHALIPCGSFYTLVKWLP